VNRKDLINIIATKHKITKKLAEDMIKTFVDTVKSEVKKGKPVRLIGFGTFKKTTRKARKGYNPRTREKIKIPRKTVPKFNASKSWVVKR
jgi:DNA-binding protein HU-beta